MILIALGANLPSQAGDPARTLQRALGELEGQGVKIARVSPFYETPAWPDPAQPNFVNAVAVLQTFLQPVELLALLHGVETALGRLRSAPNAPRTLDLDLLDYGGRIITEPGLTLPHPRLAERSFVLVPLRDVAPDWRHPITGRGVEDLLAGLADRDVPKKLP